MEEIITLDYGSGGKKTARLIEEMFLPLMDNSYLRQLGDGAVLPGLGEMAFSTDSFVVNPLFFPGGNIGKLAVCGTVNDLAVCGAVPRYLSCSFIIEEGLPLETLRKIAEAMAECAKTVGVNIVTGDTKVVERGRGDGIYINTAGIGELRRNGLDVKNIRPGDKVLVSGTMGDHGTAVMLARSNLLKSSIESDCAPMHRICLGLAEQIPGLRVMRDPTRGGLATTLNEFTEGADFSIEIEEAAIPVQEAVTSACDMLGLDPLYCANEGKILAICAEEDAQAALELMRSLPEGANAAIIGTVRETYPGKTLMRTRFGGTRILQKLAGAQLPRIC